MKRLYQSTFDQLRLSDESTQRIRRRLQAASARTEVTPRKQHLRRVVPAAAVLVVLLTCATVASGAEFWRYTQLFTGHAFSAGHTVEGELDISIEQEAGTCITVEDGRIYYNLSGQWEDITGQCSETDYFSYELTDKEGNRQVLLVGGTPEHWGYLNVVWLSKGGAVCNSSLQRWDPWIQRACDDYEIDQSRLQLSTGEAGNWVIFHTDESGRIIPSATGQEENAIRDEQLIVPTIEEIIANGYPINERGETYGPDVNGMDRPDLILAENKDGVLGYIREADEPQPQSIEDALAMNGQERFQFNLYLQDGETIIGVF